MLGEERRHLIQRHLRATGSVRTPELARMLGVSLMTAWRDLGLLERQGCVRRVHGGAMLPEKEPNFSAKAIHAAEAKRAIARWAAAHHLRPGMTLAIEGGTTAVALMPHLSQESRLTVLTNSLEVVRQAADGVNVYCSGGLSRPVSQTLVGPEAVRFFQQHRADLALISATAVNDELELVDPNPLEAEVKRALCQGAARIILLLDASKWSGSSVLSVLPMSEIDVVITEAAPPRSIRAHLRRIGVSLEIVPKTGR